MSEQRSLYRSGVSPKPREFCRSVENRANGIRKLLSTVRDREMASESSGRMDDAVRLAVTVEALAAYGQTCPAEEATDLAESLEVFIDMLVRKVDELSAS